MGDVVEKIIEAVYKHGGVSGVVTVMMFVAMLYMFWKICVTIFKVIWSGDIPEFVLNHAPFLRRFIASSIKRHTIFDRYNTILNKINHADINCPLRKRIFARLLTVRAEKHKEELEKFLDSGVENLDSYTLKIKLEALLVRSHDAWTSDKRLEDLPKVIFRKFDEQIFSMKIFVRKLLNEFCDSNTISGGAVGRINQILDTLVTMEDSVLVTIEEVIDKLNGDISSIEFENEKCRNCSESCEYKASTHAETKPFFSFKNILLVEDDEGYAAMVKKGLKRFGINVYVAKNLPTAMEALDSIDLDAVVLDYILQNNAFGTDLEVFLKRKRLPYIIYTGGDSKTIDTTAKILNKNASLIEMCEAIRLTIEESVKS